ncbi:MAG: cupredoxin domain-containing protein, partial [Candidatus Aenigmatarchaeota archaeon]
MNKFVIPILLISVLFVAGCTSTQTTQPQPPVDIVSPTEGQIIAGTGVTVTMSASNIKLTAPNGTIVNGEGHFHLWLDNANEQRGAKTTFTFENVSPGTHTLKVELHKGDHSLYEGTAKTVSFMITAPTLSASTLPFPVKEFNMTAKKFEFMPGMITVNKGDDVVINALSLDVTHGFSIPEYNIIETLSPGVTKTIRFIADKAGWFTFSCSVYCGSGHS